MATNARTAAERLGITQSAVHDMVRAGRLVASGRPALIDDASITRVAHERRTQALHRVGDELEFAQKVASILAPKPIIITRANGAPDPDAIAASMQTPRGAGALHLVPADAWSIFGPTVLQAAAARPEWDSRRRGCLTCWTRLSATVHKTMRPRGNSATRVLLGGPCEKDAAVWERERSENKLAMTRMRQQMQGRARIDLVERIHRERAAAMAEVRRATERFGRANAEWKRLPDNFRTGGRR